MAQGFDPTWRPELIRLWRSGRNRAIRRLRREANLTPTQISRLRFTELYQNNQPVEVLMIPERIAGAGRARKVRLSDELRYDLMVLNLQPFLFCDYPLTRPAFSRRMQGPALSPRQIHRIITRPLRGD